MNLRPLSAFAPAALEKISNLKLQEEALLDEVSTRKGADPLTWDVLIPIYGSSNDTSHTCSRVRVIAQIHSSKHAVFVAFGMESAPKSCP